MRAKFVADLDRAPISSYFILFKQISQASSLDLEEDGDIVVVLEFSVDVLILAADPNCGGAGRGELLFEITGRAVLVDPVELSCPPNEEVNTGADTSLGGGGIDESDGSEVPVRAALSILPSNPRPGRMGEFALKVVARFAIITVLRGAVFAVVSPPVRSPTVGCDLLMPVSTGGGGAGIGSSMGRACLHMGQVFV